MEDEANVLDLIDEEIDQFDLDLEDEEENNGVEVGDGVIEEVGQEVGQEVQEKKKKRTRRAGKRKNKTPAPRFDIDSYVAQFCKKFKEKRVYAVYSAIDCIGKVAFDKLAEEVNAIQAAGGQKACIGNRLKSGGGIFWSLLKTADKDNYRVVMRRYKHIMMQCGEAKFLGRVHGDA